MTRDLQTAALAAVLVLLTAESLPGKSIPIEEDDLDHAATVSIGVERMHDRGAYEDAAFANSFLETYDNARASGRPFGVNEAHEAFEAATRRRQDVADAFKAVDDWERTDLSDAAKATGVLHDVVVGAAGSVPVPIVGAVAGATNAARDAAEREDRRNMQAAAIDSASAARAAMAATYPRDIARLDRLARRHPELGPVIREKLNGLGVDVGGSRDELFTRHPAIAARIEVQERLGAIETLVRENGERALTEAQVQSLLRAELKPVHRALGEQQEQLKVLLARENRRIAEAAEREQRQRQRIAFDEKLRASEAGITILSTLVSEADPAAARRIASIGGATVATVRAADAFGERLDAGSGWSESGAALIFSGDLLKIGMSLFSAFADPGPPIEQIILDEIRGLRDEIAEMHNDMLDGFDRLDKRLVASMRLNHEYFIELSNDLRDVKQQIEQVQRALAVALRGIEALDDAARQHALDEAERELTVAWEEAFRRRWDGGTERISQTDFHRLADVFKTDALTTASSEAAIRTVVPQDWSLLARQPPATNLKLIGQLAAAETDDRSLAAIAASLRNPDIFCRGANYYVDLALAHPEHLAARPVSHIDQMLAELDRIERFNAHLRGEAVPSITLVLPFVLTDTGPSAMLALVERYERHRAAFFAGVAKSEKDWLAEHDLAGIDLFQKPPAEATGAVNLPATASLAEGASGSRGPAAEWTAPDRDHTHTYNGNVVVPAAVADDIPAVFKLAAQYGVGTFTVTYSAVYWDDRKRGEPTWYRARDEGRRRGDPIDAPRQPDPSEVESPSGAARTIHHTDWFQAVVKVNARPCIDLRVSFSINDGWPDAGRSFDVLKATYRTTERQPFRTETIIYSWESARGARRVRNGLHRWTLAQTGRHPHTYANLMEHVLPEVEFDRHGEPTLAGNSAVKSTREAVQAAHSSYRDQLSRYLIGQTRSSHELGRGFSGLVGADAAARQAIAWAIPESIRHDPALRILLAGEWRSPTELRDALADASPRAVGARSARVTGQLYGLLGEYLSTPPRDERHAALVRTRGRLLGLRSLAIDARDAQEWDRATPQ